MPLIPDHVCGDPKDVESVYVLFSGPLGRTAFDRDFDVSVNT